MNDYKLLAILALAAAPLVLLLGKPQARAIDPAGDSGWRDGRERLRERAAWPERSAADRRDRHAVVGDASRLGEEVHRRPSHPV
jgi:hypothetical protein